MRNVEPSLRALSQAASNCLLVSASMRPINFTTAALPTLVDSMVIRLPLFPTHIAPPYRARSGLHFKTKGKNVLVAVPVIGDGPGDLFHQENSQSPDGPIGKTQAKVGRIFSQGIKCAAAIA